MAVAAAAVLAIAGLVLLAVTGGTAATGVAIGLLSVAGVVAISAAFYAVGRSEDAERERRGR